jgi:hypothetical protein
MPVDSIIATIITSAIVRIMITSKVGGPKAKGVTASTQCALATLSKFILPSAIAIAQPATMPSSAEMLAMKPFMYFTSSRTMTSSA